jgi:hypothetical protein
MNENISESLLSYAPRPIRTHVPEGLTLIFEAPQRWGKTLSAIMWALDAFQRGRNVFSNIQLGFPHNPLEFEEIKLETGASKFWNGWIFIDELNFYFDGRRSMSVENIEFSTFLLQQKKQGCTITGTTHALDSLDPRLRSNYDYLFQPEVFPKYPEVPQAVRWKISNGPLQSRYYKDITLDCRPFLGLYDTFATYDPFRAKKKRMAENKFKRRAVLEDD